MARLRIVATVSWEIEGETPEQLADLAQKQLETINFPRDKTNFRFLMRLDKLKDKPKKIRLGEFSPAEVIPFITREETKREYHVDGKTYAVRMNSQRYFIFRESLQCAACGLVGCKMLLEQHPSDKSPHFNLYGEENGRLVMMTKDHVQPKAFGGEDRHSNYQVLDQICNSLKGSSQITNEGIRQLRKIYNENHNKVCKKALHQMIKEARDKLPQIKRGERIGINQRKNHYASRKAEQPLVIATTDIHIWETEQGLIGRSAYETNAIGEHIASIKCGTFLEPAGCDNNRVIVTLGGDQLCKISEGLLDYVENTNNQGGKDVYLQSAGNAGGTTEDNSDRSHDPVREARRILDSQIA